ncbi:MAG: hypothetical protein ACSHWW_01100 [Nonlabens sp.]|uniref:hypothetical protein n=1 Tax=Nonlabens sp. TaxID=1888209 RepID=UPI003EF56435
MNNELKFYKESGSYNLGNLGFTFLALIAVSLVLGYVYAILTQVSPIIYLNALAALGAGIAINFCLTKLFDVFKIRSRMFRILFAVLIALLTWYFQWTVTLLYLLYDGVPSITDYFSNLGWAFTDTDLRAVLPFLYENGYYEIKGAMVSGVFLGIIWLAELLIFIGFPVFASFTYEPTPYSDSFEKWYDQYVINKSFRVMNKSQVTLEELNNNAAEKIQSLTKAGVNGNSIISLFYLPEEGTQYLHVANLTYEGEKKEEKLTTIVNCLAISKDQAQLIMSQNDCVKV